MECKICYLEYPEYKFISAGCCSLKVCSECIKELDKCPQCKKLYFWTKIKDNDKSQININWQMQYEINNLQHSLSISEQETLNLSKKILHQSKEIKELKNIIASHINISHQYQKQYDNVILKYHLNLI